MALENHAIPHTLLDLFSNDLILRHTSPYIGIRSLVSLAATSKAYQSLVYDTPQTFRHVDLHETRSLGLRCQDCCNGEDCHRGHKTPGTFNALFQTLESRHVLQDVRTLILDDVYIPSAFIEDVLFHDPFRINLLSVRRSPCSSIARIDETLRRLLRRHFAKDDNLKKALKPRGIYIFGCPSGYQELLNQRDPMKKIEAVGVTASMGAQLGASVQIAENSDNYRRGDPYSDSPYATMGPSQILALSHWTEATRPKWASEWPEILEACAGSISFDAVLCRHNRENLSDPGPKVATVRLAGCLSCGTCPEGPAYPGLSPAAHLPLLSPPPLHSSKVEMAQCIFTNRQPYPPLILRCRTCLIDRWCEKCNSWWCESCYAIPKRTSPTKGDTVSGPASNGKIKVHNGLCVSRCLMDELLNGAGEGGMWG